MLDSARICHALALSLLLAGCTSNAPQTSTEAPPPARDPGLDAFSAEARALVKTMGSRLKGALLEAVSKDGPARAIEVCSHKAPEMAQELSRGELSIRRIGTRLRNPQTNAPTPSQADVLGKLTKANPTFAGELDGRATFMQAIFVGELCLGCHGDRTTLKPEVVKQLTTLYPNDEAVGYKAGDLRGAFVVQAKMP